MSRRCRHGRYRCRHSFALLFSYSTNDMMTARRMTTSRHRLGRYRRCRRCRRRRRRLRRRRCRRAASASCRRSRVVVVSAAAVVGLRRCRCRQ